MWVKFLTCDAGNGFGCILKGFSAFFAGKRRSLGRVSPVVWKGCAEAGSVPCGRCRKELLRGGVRRLWFPGLPAVPGGSVPDGFMCGVYRLHRDLLPVAGRSAGRVSCGGRCRLRRGLLLRMGGLRAGYSGRWPGRAGRRSPLSVPCGVGSGIDPLKQGPAGAGRQLPLYNYDSGCFIFDTMAESRINTLPKPDVIFFQDIISLKNNCYCNYQTGRVRFYCAGLVYLYF